MVNQRWYDSRKLYGRRILVKFSIVVVRCACGTERVNIEYVHRKLRVEAYLQNELQVYLIRRENYQSCPTIGEKV
uniref:Transposase n=1 Tax=Romanomermis culicivorax TaxID=13658 RepID=A0A915LAI6_ROMCU